ncbi:Acetyltransferase (GNAT) family protein [Roseivivax jejudonensis]|uniref:Acetyltransferase (GNAT) family protein n=1 Tax=Roseivivax jejudonensis TaxID=1529041 RepID=A0A1X6Z2C8_9RHOB|nr:GNAT family N-acetyltransferase [Roseivivax jejudonensis]SLN38153.1 Acetyltransferase (GNAT) family protein [Roseivivax jejudonensis]
MELVIPTLDRLPGYVDALERGWTPDTLRPEVAGEQLDAIARDAGGFVARQDDPEARGGPVRLPDGSQAARLPSLRRWIWADGFCGAISLRWQPGTDALPPTCLGHVGYAVVPWRRGQGHATTALRAILPVAAALGLRRIEVVTDPVNAASIRVIERAGGVLAETFTVPDTLGGGAALRYRIATPGAGAETARPAGPAPVR